MNIYNLMLEHDREQKRKDRGEFLRQEILRLPAPKDRVLTPITFNQLFDNGA